MRSRVLFAAILSNLRDLPFDLDFAITNRCNLKCVHCSSWRYYEEQPEKCQMELSVAEIARIFSQYDGFKVLGLTGGEPYLRKDLPEIVEVILRTQKGLQELFITTNGQLPETVLEALGRICRGRENKRRELQLTQFVSVDGPRDLHDQIRGVDGAYDRAIRTLDLTSELRSRYASFSLGSVTTCSPFNIDRFDEVLNEIEALKCKYDLEPSFCIWFEGQLYKNIGRHRDANVEEFRTKLTHLLPRIRSVVKAESLASKGRCLFYDLLGLWLKNPSSQVVPCGAARVRYFLSPEADLYPCTIFNHRIGNLRNYDYDLWRALGSNSRKETRYLVEDEKCPICCNTCETIPAMMSKPFHTGVKWLRSKT